MQWRTLALVPIFYGIWKEQDMCSPQNQMVWNECLQALCGSTIWSYCFETALLKNWFGEKTG